MRRAVQILILFLVCASSSRGGGGGQSIIAEGTGNLIATPVRVVEQREEQMDPIYHGAVCGPSLSVGVKFEGEALRNAVAWANLRVDEAVDDRGTQLPVSKTDLMHNAGLNLIDAPSIARRFVVAEIELGAPSRAAQKISRLRGQFQLRTDDHSSRTVTVPKLKAIALAGMNHQVLTVAGIQLEMGIGIASGNRELYGSIKGNVPAVRKIEVYDDDGKVLDEATLRKEHDFGRRPDTRVLINLPRAVDDRMSLKIEIARGQKVLTIPFDLRDIPLP